MSSLQFLLQTGHLLLFSFQFPLSGGHFLLCSVQCLSQSGHCFLDSGQLLLDTGQFDLFRVQLRLDTGQILLQFGHTIIKLNPGTTQAMNNVSIDHRNDHTHQDEHLFDNVHIGFSSWDNNGQRYETYGENHDTDQCPAHHPGFLRSTQVSPPPCMISHTREAETGNVQCDRLDTQDNVPKNGRERLWERKDLQNIRDQTEKEYPFGNASAICLEYLKGIRNGL